MNSLKNSIHLKIKNSNIVKIGMDIGGSLTKISLALSKDNSVNVDLRKKIYTELDFLEEIELEENYLFIRLFQTSKFNVDFVEFLKKLNEIYSLKNLSTIYATGGGAYKFFDFVDKEFGIKMEKNDELMSLVKGYIMMNNYRTFYQMKIQSAEDKTDDISNDLNNNKTDEIDKENENEKISSKYSIVDAEDFEFPHIAVNIGSGVSVLQVNSINDVTRVTGTLMGGGTLIGLSKLLINVDNYNDIMKLAESGDNRNLDLLVKDIYGAKTTSNLGLDSDVIAASFGKIHHYIQRGDHKEKVRKEDIAKSLLVMICYHIAQLAFLTCKQNNIKKVYYFGNFSRRNSYAIEWLDYATKFWDKELSIRFNLYDGFLGSIGSMVEYKQESDFSNI